MIPIAAGTTRLGDLFDPVAGVLPTGILANDTIDTTRQSFTNRVETRWDDTPFKLNNQGQKWELDYRIIPSLPPYFASYTGVKQVSTPRRFTTGVVKFGGDTTVNMFFGHVMEFEFVFTGQKLSFEFLNLGGDGAHGGTLDPNTIQYGSDCQVYIEYGGRMWKAADLPKTTTNVSGNRDYRNISFTDPYHGRIRFVCSGGFICISTEASAIIAPSPPRPFIIMDGDSYVEAMAALTADSTTQWFTTGIIDQLFERTGFIFARRGQGGTGFFTNGAGQIFDDTVAQVTDTVKTYKGPSRFLSADRWRWMTDATGYRNDLTTSVPKAPFVNYPGEDFGQPLGRRPLAYVLNGTWNDASGANFVTEAQMYARAKQAYQLLRATDRHCTFVHISPEPFDDALFGATVGAPTTNDKSDTHRQGQMRAAAEVARTRYINIFGPDAATRLWTGNGPQGPVPGPKGTQGLPATSQQAQLVSVNDGIHYTRVGGRYFANKIADAMAEIRVPTARVNGFV